MQRLEFLAAAAEDEGIAALQADDALALPRMFDQQCIDLFLRAADAAGRLADANARGVAPRCQ